MVDGTEKEFWQDVVDGIAESLTNSLQSVANSFDGQELLGRIRRNNTFRCYLSFMMAS